MTRPIEILAPAGSMEALKAAVHAGADAIYLGGNRFGARAYADNFDEETLIYGIEYAHLYGVKVYLTINTVFRNEEIQALYDYLLPLYKAGLDAVIVQDLGVVLYVHQCFPDMPIHASTQMTITTKYAYKLLKQYGVTRIVPARELSLAEIAELKSEDAPELEVFVQGALCYCYSGQCLMSSMLGGRSGNRGRCAQPCRLPYQLKENQGELVDTEGVHLLSPKDLCGLESIPALIEAGVDSFKIEGRMKSPQYVAACVRAYRNAVDAYYEDTLSNELIEDERNHMAQLFNRGGFTDGYYNKKNGKDMMSVISPGDCGVHIGKIVDVCKDEITIKLSKDLEKGDVLAVLIADDKVMLTSNVAAKASSLVHLKASKIKQIKKGMRVVRLQSASLNDTLDTIISTTPALQVEGVVRFFENENCSLQLKTMVKGEPYEIIVYGDAVQTALGKPLTEEIVRDKITKVGDAHYQFLSLDVALGESVFYSLKALKELRRSAFVALDEQIYEKSRRHSITQRVALKQSEQQSSEMLSDSVVAMVSSLEQYDIVKNEDSITDVYLDLQYFTKTDIITIGSEVGTQNKYIVLPPVLRKNSLEEVQEVWSALFQSGQLNGYHGIVVRNVDEFAFVLSYGYQGMVVVDYSLYTMNDWAAAFYRLHFPSCKITLPVELNERQINELQYVKQHTELIVYGYQQLMISAQCVWKTNNRCDESNRAGVLLDRYNKQFFVRPICKYCYNLIYNGIPTVLFEKSQKVGRYRMHFTKESKEEVRTVLSCYFQNKAYPEAMTKGHFNRGVE